MCAWVCWSIPVPVSVTSSSTKRLGDVLGLDAQAPAVGHRVARIDHQIQDNLLDLPGIGFYTIELGIQHKRELNVLFDQAAQHLVQIANGLVDIQHHGLNHLLTAEHQELASERSRAAARLFDLLEAAAVGVQEIRTLEEQFAVTVDHGEQVVEVVSHTASEKTNGF